MTKQMNGWPRIVLTVVTLVGAVLTVAGAHYGQDKQISANTIAIAGAKVERVIQGNRLRFMEFILLRLADKQGIDVGGFK